MLAVGPFGFGPIELILVLTIVIVLFGAGRLSEVGGAIGHSIRDFRQETRERKEQTNRSNDET
jgi:sec-independent protein translocase protein TatA